MMPARAAAGGESIPLATLWAMGAAIGWASMAVVVRYLEGRVPSWDISFYRALVALAVLAAPLVFHGRHLRALVPKRHLFGSYLFRGVIIFAAQAMYYHSLMYIPLADAAVLNASAPIFSVFLATVMLRESVGLDRWFLILLGFVGVIVIIRPGYEKVQFEALLALGSAVLFAFSAILNKQLIRSEGGASIVYGTNFFVAILGVVVVLGWGARPSWADLGIIALIGVAGAFAQYCWTQALRYAEVNFVSPFEFMRVPLVALGAWMLFSQVPPLLFFLGAVLIFLSAFLLARRAVRRPAPVPRPAE